MAKKDEVKISKAQARWVGEIETYETKFKPWQARSEKIIKRYIDERSQAEENKTKYNILWSNVQTLLPAIYAKPPIPNIDRRYDSDDELGAYSALVLERATSYYVQNDIFDKVMKQAALDKLLPGRGVAWVRYCPVFEPKLQVTDDTIDEDQYEDVLSTENVAIDYIHWRDFGHTWGRTWQEVDAVWRKVYLDRDALIERFGEDIGSKIPLDCAQKGTDGLKDGEAVKAEIYEIWNKKDKTVIWLHKAMPDILDIKDDPLKLKDFLPCPEPIYGTISNDNLIPVPDYAMYQNQARELDDLTARIASITEAVKVAGVYDASAEGIGNLLSSGTENKLIPVKQWAVLGGGRGLDGVISMLPLGEIITTLQSLYEAREQVKKDLYEISGISDIVRGQGVASETATAQRIKGQFATLRLDHQQKEVSRFARDLVVIITEIIAKHFSMDTIKAVSGVRLLTEMEKQQIMLQAQSGQPMPEEVQELLNLPTWEQVEALIRNDTARDFRIDIETDSTIKTDQDNEKQARTEFLASVSQFMAQAVNVPPSMQKLAMELLMFGVRGFKVSRQIEGAFDDAMKEIKKASEQPQQPDPAAEAEKQKTEFEKVKMDQDKYLSDQNFNLEMEKIGLEKEKINADVQKATLDAKSKVPIELALSDPTFSNGQVPPLVIAMQDMANALSNGLQMIAKMQAQSNADVINAIQNPPERIVMRDKAGNVIGVK